MPMKEKHDRMFTIETLGHTHPCAEHAASSLRCALRWTISHGNETPSKIELGADEKWRELVMIHRINRKTHKQRTDKTHTPINTHFPICKHQAAHHPFHNDPYHSFLASASLFNFFPQFFFVTKARLTVLFTSNFYMSAVID